MSGKLFQILKSMSSPKYSHSRKKWRILR